MADINGNPYIGVFCRQAGSIALCPMETPDEFISQMKEVMGVEALRTAAGSTNLHGSLIAANRKGIILPYFYTSEEVLTSLGSSSMEDLDIRVEVSEDPHTAWGNNVLLSDTLALVNPDLQPDSLTLIEDVFDVEVVKGTIAGIKTIGSIAVLNSKGMVVHPKATHKDKERLKELFKVDPYISTANFGSPYLGASMVANDRGALVGSKSSGVELNRIENSLDIVD
jgi:translation initiation factor 6